MYIYLFILISKHRFDLAIDECASNPCMHGAACEDHAGYYVCHCRDRFTGLHCEIGKLFNNN